MRRLVRDLPLGSVGRADCGCRAEVWRKERGHGGRILAWIKVRMTCTGIRCIMCSSKSPWFVARQDTVGLDGLTRKAIDGDLSLFVDPLELALEEAFGDND